MHLRLTPPIKTAMLSPVYSKLKAAKHVLRMTVRTLTLRTEALGSLAKHMSSAP